MAELLLELFSEEIPARMQARAAEDLVRLLSAEIAPVQVGDSAATNMQHMAVVRDFLVP